MMEARVGPWHGERLGREDVVGGLVGGQRHRAIFANVKVCCRPLHAPYTHPAII